MHVEDIENGYRPGFLGDWIDLRGSEQYQRIDHCVRSIVIDVIRCQTVVPDGELFVANTSREKVCSPDR